MTGQKLYCDFIAAKRKASELERVAGNIRRLSNNNLQSECNAIDSNWDGEASEAFLKKVRTLQNNLAAQADALDRTADTIRRVAEMVYKSEMRALEIAQKRSYKK